MRSQECALCKKRDISTEVLITRTHEITQKEHVAIKTSMQYAVSLLDPADRRSDVHQSVFPVFYNLALMCGGIYIFSTYISYFITSGGLYNPSLFLCVFLQHIF